MSDDQSARIAALEAKIEALTKKIADQGPRKRTIRPEMIMGASGGTVITKGTGDQPARVDFGAIGEMLVAARAGKEEDDE